MPGCRGMPAGRWSPSQLLPPPSRWKLTKVGVERSYTSSTQPSVRTTPTSTPLVRTHAVTAIPRDPETADDDARKNHLSPEIFLQHLC